MKILAIDTSTEACSAALHIDGECESKYELAPREHSRLILGMVNQLLEEADCALSELDALAFGRGPGSFMGLRIAAGVTQGIAFVHETPVIPVSTLQAIAEVASDVSGCTKVLSTIDARMDEVYWAAYEKKDACWMSVQEEAVLPPEQVEIPNDLSDWVGAGTGWRSYQERLLAKNNQQSLKQILPECFPTAEAIANIAATDEGLSAQCHASKAVPVYLRNNVAKKPAPIKF